MTTQEWLAEFLKTKPAYGEARRTAIPPSGSMLAADDGGYLL